MSDEIDYSSLPLEERLVHKVWKVRLGAYEDLTKEFERSRNENDKRFQEFNNRPELIKTFISDSNVVAQESAIKAFSKYLEFGGTASNVSRLKNASVIKVLCEKTLSSARKNTKEYAIECLLLFIEKTNDVDGVIEEILPSLKHRLPKLVAGCTSALHIIVENYGCNVISPKLIVPSLSKLFAHADRTVRAEATKLTVELYLWMKDSLVTILFSDLKPVQQKDLTALFDSQKDTKIEQKRYTAVQKEEIARRQEIESAKTAEAHRESLSNADEDVEMTEANYNGDIKFDPYDIADPIEVLSKIPTDFNSRLTSTKWKDRKEALDEVVTILEKTVKLAPGDYTSLIRSFAKCMKDANIQVVQLAASCTEFLVKGLRDDFLKYVSIILGPMIERTKEKKASVATSLSNALDSIFSITSLSEILEETINGMSNKIPQVKIASTNYLQRCLAETKNPPTSTEIDSIMGIGVKLLADSQEPVRQASTEMIGTLMKITGERELAGFIEKIDENRKNKVRSFYEKVSVKCAERSSSQPKQVSRNVTKEHNLSAFNQPNRKPSNISMAKKLATPTIPAKRGATSPVKRNEDTSKVPAFGRGLTGRSLISSNPPAFQQESQPNINKADFNLTNAELEELNILRTEKEIWLEEKQKQSMLQLQFSDQKLLLNQEINQLKSRNEDYVKDYNNAMLMLKQKDTQILRLNSDLENAKLKIRDLEQTIEMMKLQQNQLQAQQSFSSYYSPSVHASMEEKRSPQASDSSRTRINSGELSSRVKRLSIEGEALKENIGSPYSGIHSSSRYESPQRMSDNTNTFGSSISKDKIDVDSNEDSWRRAAEVTSQLKARIEKMKARARSGY